MLEPVTCRCCDQTIHPRDNAGTGDLPLCLTCLEDRYTACARCGTLIPNHQACYLPSGVDEDARTLQRGVHAQHLRPLHAQHARAGCGHHRSNDRPGSGVTQSIEGALSKRQRALFL